MKTGLLEGFSYIKELFTSRFPFFPDNIKDALFITLFCVIGFIELYLFIASRRFYQKFLAWRESAWKENIATMLANIIVYGDEEETEDIVAHFLPRFKKIPIYRKNIREMLIKELLVYHFNFTGKTADVLKELYLRLKLDRYASRKLKSRYWETQIEGIREITQLWLRQYSEMILKLTDDENSQLRM